MSTDLPAPLVEKSNRYPPGIPYIVGNEAAERFSFYGMRAILQVYGVALLTGFVPEASIAAEKLRDANADSAAIYHTFVAGVYAFPLLGAILADRLLGKFPVILWVSLIYCLGHGALALFGRHEWGFYTGLALIALGSGGIKPCVSANVGDQFTSANAHLVPRIFQIFYFSINFGSFFATLLIPWIYMKYGASDPAFGGEVAFAVPGILMGIATVIFWLGRNKFVKVLPTPGGLLALLDFCAAFFLFLSFAVFVFVPKEWEIALGTKFAVSGVSLVIWVLLFRARQSLQEDAGFLSVLFYALRNQRLHRPGMGFFGVARERFGSEAAEGPPAVLKLMVVFSMITAFWALFDQHGSTWVVQAGQMDLKVNFYFFTHEFASSQIQSLNPLLVMILIPLTEYCLYRPLQRRGVIVKPLTYMTVGMFLAALSFVAVAIYQGWIEASQGSEEKVHVVWQVIPYFLLTTGEVFVSVIGLEFAYTQAPRAMKSTIMSFFFLTMTLGNILTASLTPLQKTYSLSTFFWLFAGIMAAASVVFAVLAYFYKGKTYLQDGARK